MVRGDLICKVLFNKEENELKQQTGEKIRNCSNIKVLLDDILISECKEKSKRRGVNKFFKENNVNTN